MSFGIGRQRVKSTGAIVHCDAKNGTVYFSNNLVKLVCIFGRPFVKRFALCYRSVVCPVLSVLSVTFVHCGQMAGWIKMPLDMEEGLGPGDFVLDGDRAPLPKKGAEPLSPIFGPCLLWPNGWMDHMALDIWASVQATLC